MERQPELFRIGYSGVVPIHWDAEKSAEDPGSLTGWAAVYNVVDQQDDVLVHGALRKAITDWRSSNRVIPLTLDHQNTAEGVIGSLAKAEDTSYGLRATFKFSSTPAAQDVRTKAREGHLNGLSIFGPIIEKAFDTVVGKSVRILKQVGLISVGLTPVPANAGALVLAAKTDEFVMKPLQHCQSDGKPGWRWGDTGKCYTYTAGDDASEAAARKKAMAQAAAMGAFPGTGGKALDFDEFSAAMLQALNINHPAAKQAAVHILLGSYTWPSPAVAPPEDEPAATDVSKDTAVPDDAAAYALSLIGQSGPDVSPPDGEPSRTSLAESLVASLDVAKTSSELDLLEEQIGKELGRE